MRMGLLIGIIAIIALIIVISPKGTTPNTPITYTCPGGTKINAGASCPDGTQPLNNYPLCGPNALGQKYYCDAEKPYCLKGQIYNDQQLNDVCVTCRTDSDCSAGQICDAAVHDCAKLVIECYTDSDCSASAPYCTKHWNPGTGWTVTYQSCVECRTSSDCPTDNPICNWNRCGKENIIMSLFNLRIS